MVNCDSNVRGPKLNNSPLEHLFWAVADAPTKAEYEAKLIELEAAVPGIFCVISVLWWEKKLYVFSNQHHINDSIFNKLLEGIHMLSFFLFLLSFFLAGKGDYLNRIPHELWTLYGSIERNVSKYGQRTNNSAEQTNSRLKAARVLTPLRFIKAVTLLQLQDKFNRYHTALQWQKEGRLVVPYADAMFKQEKVC